MVLTAREVADLLKISLWSVYDLTRRGELPYFKVGRCNRYLHDELMEWAKRDRARRL